jgi:hypothetical protein
MQPQPEWTRRHVFVVENEDLFDTLSKLVEGDSEPVKAK